MACCERRANKMATYWNAMATHWNNIFIKIYCCPVKLFKQNKLGLTLLTRYQPFWLSLFLLN